MLRENHASVSQRALGDFTPKTHQFVSKQRTECAVKDCDKAMFGSHVKVREKRHRAFWHRMMETCMAMKDAVKVIFCG